jgi:hypothetical protein
VVAFSQLTSPRHRQYAVGVKRKRRTAAKHTAASITIDRSDGQVIGPASWPLGNGDDLNIKILDEIKPRFELGCPICGARATEEEHVPPESIGGAVMTQTCNPCNNRLGGNVEGELQQWFHVEVTSAKFWSPHFLGARPAGHVLIRSTSRGDLVPFITRSDDRRHRSDSEAVDSMLQRGGPAKLTGLLPDTNRVWISLFKQAYLSFWLKHGRPGGWLGDQARAELITAREADKQEIPPSTLAHRMTVGRGPVDPEAPPVAEAIAYEPSGRALRGAVLVGSLFVSWDFDMRRPAPQPVDRQFSVDFDIGKSFDGTVSSVVLPTSLSAR